MLLPLLLATVLAQADGGDVHLILGEVRTVDTPGAARIAVGEPSVVDVKARDGRIELTGLSAGDTTVAWWKESGERVNLDVTVEAQVAVAGLKDGAKQTVHVGESLVYLKDPAWKVLVPKAPAVVSEQQPKGMMVRGVEKGEAEVVLHGPKGEVRQLIVKVVPINDARLTAIELVKGETVTLNLTDLTHANAVDTDVLAVVQPKKGVLQLKALAPGTTLVRLGFAGDVPRTGLNVTVAAPPAESGKK